jgi:hypothetical protein
VSVISMPIANAVKDAQSIFACFSVGGGIVILINFP